MDKDAPIDRASSGHEARDRELFDAVAEAYARKDTIPSSRIARRHRLLQTIRAIPLPANPRLLEVGCGAGFSAPYLRGKFQTFWGIDYAEKLIDYAKQHNAGPGVTFSTANIKDLSTDDQFDVIFMIGVLHHIDDMPQAVEQMVRLLNPGGWLVANEPHPANPLNSAARKMRKKIDTRYSEEQR